MKLAILVACLAGSAYSQVTILPTGTVGSPYSATTLSGFVYLLSGSLPAGLSLSSGGAITGTPTTPGVSTFTVGINSDVRQPAAQFQISVVAALSLVPNSLPVGTVGSGYPATSITAMGGVPPYTFSLASGSLPGGLSLSSGGVISGTPGSPGTSGFTVRVTDSRDNAAIGAYQIAVSQAVTITPTIVPSGITGVGYGPVQFGTNAGSGLTFSASNLPPGLLLSSAGVLSGVPTQAGAYTFAVSVYGQYGTGTATITTRIYPNLSLGQITIPPIDPGVPTQTTVAATGGTPPISYVLSNCSIAGLTLGPAGVFGGTATTSGTYNCVITATDSNGVTASTGFAVTVLPALTMIAPSLSPGIVAVSYPTVQLSASGGKAPYSWSIAGGSLPPGLTFNSAGGLAGTPTAAGTYAFTVQATDSAGATASAQLSITVNGAPSITGTLPGGTLNLAYGPASLTATGGSPPYTFAVLSGTLPPGLSLSSSGVVTGTPTQTGQFNFTVQVTDANRLSASNAFAIQIGAAPLTITTTSLTGATGGSAYSQTLSASGGSAPYAWQVVAGGLPAGLTLNSTGVLSGTPATQGSSNFTVQVTDSEQPAMTASQSFTIGVTLPPVSPLTIGNLPATTNATQQPSFNVTLATPYPLPISGTLTLTFTSAAIVPGDDPSVVFMNGMRTLPFTIPANQTNATFAVPQLLSTGTVAGTITITADLQAGGVDITPNPAPAQTLTVSPAPPVIASVKATNTGGQLTLVVQGYATTRQVTSATFQFSSTTINVNVGNTFTQWYQSAPSLQFGSAFTYTQPFSLQGQVAGPVTVTLVNDRGNSNQVSALP